jgi:nitrate/nitrite transporter NarK
MCLVALASDLGTAPVWAWTQDVGGRHVGSVMGWANMWGNFGAALAPLIFTKIQDEYPKDPAAGWAMVFAVCAATQIVGAIAALGISSEQQIEGAMKRSDV